MCWNQKIPENYKEINLKTSQTCTLERKTLPTVDRILVLFKIQHSMPV